MLQNAWAERVEPELSSKVQMNKTVEERNWRVEIEIKMVTNLTAGD